MRVLGVGGWGGQIGNVVSIDGETWWTEHHTLNEDPDFFTPFPDWRSARAALRRAVADHLES